MDIAEYSALSELIMKLIGEGMGKNCKELQKQ